jgi:hypothetical protein
MDKHRQYCRDNVLPESRLRSPGITNYGMHETNCRLVATLAHRPLRISSGESTRRSAGFSCRSPLGRPLETAALLSRQRFAGRPDGAEAPTPWRFVTAGRVGSLPVSHTSLYSACELADSVTDKQNVARAKKEIRCWIMFSFFLGKLSDVNLYVGLCSQLTSANVQSPDSGSWKAH